MVWKKVLQRMFGGRQPEAAQKPAKRPEPYCWSAELSFDCAALGGSVPSDAVRKSFAEIAEARPGRKVIDHMELRPNPPDGWEVAARCALDALASLRSGRVSVGNSRLTIEGVALDDEGLARLKALRGGKGDRGFSVSVSGVAPPIPAAPTGPPPPEAAPVAPENRKPRRKTSTKLRGSTAKLKTGSTAASSKTTAGTSRRASSRPANKVAADDGDQAPVIAPPPARKPRPRRASGATANPAETPAGKSD